MEKFFTQHNVMRDRDPDELRPREASDSEASDDEEEITDRVHSVHDPTGPWKQTPVDGPWGNAQGKKAGTKGRFFKSEHTGPKGVINDYKAHKRQQREERERLEKERQATLMRIAKGSTISSNQPQVPVGCDAGDGSDCDCDDMLLNDAFLEKYNAMRLYQMHETAKQRNHFGQLDYISPSEYVELTDNASADVTMVVHLYHPESYQCGLINEHLEQIAKEITHIKFVSLIAREADDSITMRDLPVLMIYRGQQLDETLLNLSDKLDGEFTADRIKQLIVQNTVAA